MGLSNAAPKGTRCRLIRLQAAAFVRLRSFPFCYNFADGTFSSETHMGESDNGAKSNGNKEMTRREFVGRIALGAAAAAAVASAAGSVALAAARALAAPEAGTIPKRKLGKTGYHATILGLGGCSIPGGSDAEKVAAINRAIDLGVNYCDTASQYGNRQAEKRLGMVMKTRRKEVFLATKTLERADWKAEAEIADSLKYLQTDVIDLIQLHSINDMHTLEMVMGKSGSFKAAEKMQRQGYVRFIGITGHTRPEVIARALEMYPFATVLVPLGVTDQFKGDFASELIPKAREAGCGIIGMKVLTSGKVVGKLPVADCLRYTMSLPITVSIVGMGSVAEVDENVRVAKSFRPMTKAELEAVSNAASPHGNTDNMWWKKT